MRFGIAHFFGQEGTLGQKLCGIVGRPMIQ